MKRCKKYDNDWPIVAICYDFDKTLSPKDMQEFELIPKLGLDSKTFWKESNSIAFQNNMDKMLAYMYLIIKKANEVGQRLNVKDFKKMGAAVELFDGVDTWFQRINDYAASVCVNIEHYIISAGLKEIIQGTKIADYFTEIFASSFLYDHNDAPCWPNQVVNYTTKTQHLFRINKGCMDLSDEDSVNKYMPNEQRRIPFDNFIYIGDSSTDIPAMRIVSRENGHSIGVYNPREKNFKNVFDLISQERISYFAPADYTPNSIIEKIVKDILLFIKKRSESGRELRGLQQCNSIQKRMAGDYNYISDFGGWVKSWIEDGDAEIEEKKKYVFDFFKQGIRRFEKEYASYQDLQNVVASLNDIRAEAKRTFKEKGKNKKQSE
jgi:phosphoserine phosphatase